MASSFVFCFFFFYHFRENLTLSHWMCLIGLYLGTKYEVCRWNSLRDMTSSLVFYSFWGKFDLDLWPWPKVKVIGTRVIECDLLYLGTKSIGEIASEIRPVLCFLPILEKFDLDLWPWSKVKVIGICVIEWAFLGCTLVPSMKFVGKIASEIQPIIYVLIPFWGNLTLICDFKWPQWPLDKVKVIDLYLIFEGLYSLIYLSRIIKIGLR